MIDRDHPPTERKYNSPPPLEPESVNQADEGPLTDEQVRSLFDPAGYVEAEEPGAAPSSMPPSRRRGRPRTRQSESESKDPPPPSPLPAVRRTTRGRVTRPTERLRSELTRKRRSRRLGSGYRHHQVVQTVWGPAKYLRKDPKGGLTLKWDCEDEPQTVEPSPVWDGRDNPMRFNADGENIINMRDETNDLRAEPAGGHQRWNGTLRAPQL